MPAPLWRRLGEAGLALILAAQIFAAAAHAQSPAGPSGQNCFAPADTWQVQSFSQISTQARTLGQAQNPLVARRAALELREAARFLSDPAAIRVLSRGYFSIEGLLWVDELSAELGRLADAAEQGNLALASEIFNANRFQILLSRLRVAAAIGFDGCAPQSEATGYGAVTTPARLLEPLPARGAQGDGGGSGTVEVAASETRRDTVQVATLITVLLAAIVLAAFGLGAALRQKMLEEKRRLQATRHTCAYDTLVCLPDIKGLMDWAETQLSEAANAAHAEGGAVEDGLPVRVIEVSQYGLSLTQPALPVTDGEIRIRLGDNWVTAKVESATQTVLRAALRRPLSDDVITFVAQDRREFHQLALRSKFA